LSSFFLDFLRVKIYHTMFKPKTEISVKLSGKVSLFYYLLLAMCAKLAWPRRRRLFNH